MCLWRASSEADRAARLEQQAAARAERVRALREERESRRTAAARETSTELAAAIHDLAEVSLAEVSSPAAVEVRPRGEAASKAPTIPSTSDSAPSR